GSAPTDVVPEIQGLAIPRQIRERQTDGWHLLGRQHVTKVTAPHTDLRDVGRLGRSDSRFFRRFSAPARLSACSRVVRPSTISSNACADIFRSRSTRSTVACETPAIRPMTALDLCLS